jgi:hypothetical protein
VSTRLSWPDVEALVRIADADPDPKLREIATDTLAWLPLDEATGRRVLGVLADEAPQAWCDALDHHLWLLGQESRSSLSSGRGSGMDRPDEAMTAIVLLPDHLFGQEDVADLSVLRGLPDVPAQWLLTTLLRRLFTVPADDPALDVAVSRLQRIIDVLPDTAGADLVPEALEREAMADRHPLAGAALAVTRPAAVLAALLPWLRSHTPADRLEALRTLRAAARFLGRPHLFGTSSPGPRDALANLADLLRRGPGGDPAGPDDVTARTPSARADPDPAGPPPEPRAPDRHVSEPSSPGSPSGAGGEFPDGAGGDHLDEAAAVPLWSPPPADWAPPPAPPPPYRPAEPAPPPRQAAEQPDDRGGPARRWWPFRRKHTERPDGRIDRTGRPD